MFTVVMVLGRRSYVKVETAVNITADEWHGDRCVVGTPDKAVVGTVGGVCRWSDR